MEMKQRVQHLIADVERACIKYKLNMTIYDGKLAFVDQESRHIVATSSTIVSPIQYLTRYSLLLPSFFCFTGWTEYPFRNKIEATVTRSASLPILR